MRHGCDNDIMPEYLAHACATGGRLIEALSGDEVDDELLEGARVHVTVSQVCSNHKSKAE